MHVQNARVIRPKLSWYVIVLLCLTGCTTVSSHESFKRIRAGAHALAHATSPDEKLAFEVRATVDQSHDVIYFGHAVLDDDYLGLPNSPEAVAFANLLLLSDYKSQLAKLDDPTLDGRVTAIENAIQTALVQRTSFDTLNVSG